MTIHYQPPKRILYIDMDGVVANFEKAIKQSIPHWDTLSAEEKGELTDEVCGNTPNFFLNLEPIDGAIETINKLATAFDTYFLSAAMWNVPDSYTEKRLWIEKHFGNSFRKRLILTHRKDLNWGHFLIDDRTSHGAGNFRGQHIMFGSEEFPDWQSIEKLLDVNAEEQKRISEWDIISDFQFDIKFPEIDPNNFLNID
jgi:5'-nucleotidase